MFLKHIKKQKKNLFLSVVIGFILSLFFLIEKVSDTELVLSSFGSSLIIMVSLPHLSSAKISSFSFSTLMGGLLGFVFFKYINSGVIGVVLSLVILAFVMMFFDLIHPPAMSIPIIVFKYKISSYTFLFFPLLAGVLTLCVFIFFYRKANIKI